MTKMTIEVSDDVAEAAKRVFSDPTVAISKYVEQALRRLMQRCCELPQRSNGRPKGKTVKKAGLILLLFVFIGSTPRAEDRRESVLPPATIIGGALAMDGLGEVLASDMNRRKGDIRSARAHRGRAIWMSEAAVGFFFLGWWTATYYDHRFGFQTRIEF